MGLWVEALGLSLGIGRVAMAHIIKCEKCGFHHISGGECTKPFTSDEVHKWAVERLKILEEFDKQSKKVKIIVK
jgi:hypothetical protein